jgi:hypothetical protein
MPVATVAGRARGFRRSPARVDIRGASRRGEQARRQDQGGDEPITPQRV